MITRHVELRQDSPGVISGTVLRYDDVAHIGRAFHERFAPGSVSFDDVVLNLMHDRRSPVARTGAGLELMDGGRELRMKATIPDTVYGRQARELIDAKIIRGLSAEFIAQDERFEGGMRVIKRAELHGIGLVDRPAYPASTIDRGLIVPLEYRRKGLSAFIQYGVPFITSLAKRQKRIIPRGALDLADDIFLLDGYDYNRALASTAAKSLIVNETRNGITFIAANRNLRKSPVWPDVRKRISAGLVNGVIPGMMITDFDEYEDDDGFTVTRIKRGGVCEINIVARVGAGELDTGRRRRWLY